MLFTDLKKKKVQFLPESGSSQGPSSCLFIKEIVKSSMLSVTFSDKQFGLLHVF